MTPDFFVFRGLHPTLTILQISTQTRRISAARDNAELDTKKGNVTGILEWIAVDLLTSTGLRVSEAADLRCGDVKAGYGESSIWIRSGKGSISGHVVIPENLKRHLKTFIKWKADQGEPTGPDDYIFFGRRAPWAAQANQQLVKKSLRQLGTVSSGKVNTGVLIDAKLWRRFKIRRLEENRREGSILKELITEYLGGKDEVVSKGTLV